MKAERKTGRTGFIGGVTRLWTALTRNWGLKLLALILAIIVYHSLRTRTEFPQGADDRQIFQHR